jgi:phosphomannomutase
VVRTPVGEINVVDAILENQAILGGEGNGGVIDPRVGFVRDSFVAMAVVLDLLASQDESLSQIVDRLPRLAMVKDHCVLGPAAPKGDAISDLWEQIASGYPDAQADRRDGLRLDWPDRWVQVRASNTEPIVRVIAEAEDHSLARRLVDRIIERVRQAG